MSVTARRLTKRQKMSLQFQCWAPREMPRAQLERIVLHVAADGLACGLSLAGGLQESCFGFSESSLDYFEPRASASRFVRRFPRN